MQSIIDHIPWIIGSLVAVGLLMLIVIGLYYKKPEQGQVLIRTGMGGTVVSFAGNVVIPLLHKAEFLDITLKRIAIEKLGKEALTCKGETRADIKAAFFIRISPTVDDVLHVVSKLGITRPADTSALKEIYEERFIQALKTVSSQYDFETLTNRELFKEKVMDCVGRDLDGFMLDVVTIDYLGKSKQ